VGLMPLLLGERLPDDIRTALLRTLTDPAAFWGQWKLPTVAYLDPLYRKDCYWRGPVWININYFIIEALERCGREDLAVQLRDHTLDLMASQSAPFEYYDSQTGEGHGAAGYGWSAAVFVDLLMKKTAGGIALDSR